MSGDRWTPTRGSVVRILPHPHPETQPPLPSGRWKILDRAFDPNGGQDKSYWWLMSHDNIAHDWAATHLDQISSGCIRYPTRRLDPVNRVR